jgi:hypothetical protein
MWNVYVLNLPVRVLRLNQAPDTSLPPLPPDVFIIDKKGTESCPANIDAARIRFKTELQVSPSSKGRCCRTTSPVPCIEISHRVPMSCVPQLKDLLI